MRPPFGMALMLWLAACATTPEPDGEAYESKEEVMAAEARREAKEFDDRLARLRRDEEARQLARIRTSSAADSAEEEPLPEEAKDLAGAKIEEPGGLQVGSSVRALEAAKSAGPAPTPEGYLRAARCLLSADLQVARTAFEEGKRSGRQAQAGEIAVVILDSEQLMGRIDREMKHRRLPLADGECKQQREVMDLLRSLVGARIDARGLVRLTKELELRAGLSKAE